MSSTVSLSRFASSSLQAERAHLAGGALAMTELRRVTRDHKAQMFVGKPGFGQRAGIRL